MSLDQAYKAALIMRPTHEDTTHWFDSRGGLLVRVRAMRASLTNEEIVQKLVEEGQASAEQVWLCLKAAEILDK